MHTNDEQPKARERTSLGNGRRQRQRLRFLNGPWHEVYTFGLIWVLLRPFPRLLYQYIDHLLLYTDTDPVGLVVEGVPLVPFFLPPQNALTLVLKARSCCGSARPALGGRTQRAICLVCACVFGGDWNVRMRVWIDPFKFFNVALSVCQTNQTYSRNCVRACSLTCARGKAGCAMAAAIHLVARLVGVGALD